MLNLEEWDKIKKMTKSNIKHNNANKITGEGNDSSSPINDITFSVFLLAVSIILLAIALYIRLPAQKFFATSNTSPYTANVLFSRFPEPIKIFKPFLIDVLGRFLKAYIIPTILCILAIFLACLSWVKYRTIYQGKLLDATPENKRNDKDKSKAYSPDYSSYLHRIFSFLTGKRLLIILAIYLAGMILMRYFILDKVISSGDEFSYIYQAKIMSRLKAFIPGPLPTDSFASDGIVNGEKFYSKYTVGFSILLIPFVLLKIPYIINSIFAVLVIIAVFFLGKEIYGRNTGLLSAIFLAVSPFFVLNSLSVLVHTPFLFFYIIFILFFFRSSREKSLLNPLIGGLSLGFAFLIRPADIILPAILFFIAAIYFLIGKSRKKLFIRYIVMLFAFFILVGILFYFNYMQTGNPLKFGFQEYISEEKWGMGVWGHNNLKAIWNTTFNLTRLFIWLPPLMILLSIISLFEKRKLNAFLMLIAISPIIFFYFYYGLGFHEFGPRYYFTMLAVIPILASRGVIFLEQKINERMENLFHIDKKHKKQHIYIPVATIFLIFTVVFTLVGILPGISKEAVSYPWRITKFFRLIQDKFGDSPEGAVLFLQTTPKQISTYFVRNDPFFENEIITVNFLDPDINKKVIERFPQKKPYLVNYDDRTHQWLFSEYYMMPYDELSKDERIRIRITAALNYSASIYKYDKGIEQIKKGMEIDPDNVNLYSVLAMLEDARGNTDRAEEYWKKVIELNPRLSEAYLNLAIIQAKLENYNTALENFRKYLSFNPGNPGLGRARLWIEYIAGKYKRK